MQLFVDESENTSEDQFKRSSLVWLMGMVVHRCYPTIPEAEAGRLLSSRSVRSCPKTKIMLKVKHY